MHDGISKGGNAIGKEDDHGWTCVVPPVRYSCTRSLESLAEIVPPLQAIVEEIKELIWRTRRVNFIHEFCILSVEDDGVRVTLATDRLTRGSEATKGRVDGSEPIIHA